MGIFFQVIGTILLCCSCTNMGIMMAWPSSTIILFKSENTTLHRPMGAAEVSLFGSLPAIGSLIANPIAGMVLDRLGRKKCVILTSLIFVIAWSIIALTSQVEVILMAMLVGGLGFAIFLETTIYISEICQDSIRGTMTSGPMQFYGFGILVSYFLGGHLSYHQMVYACLSLSVVGVLLLSVLKESPLTLMAKGREEDAAKSIAFYRSKKATSKEVVQELDKLRRIFHSHSEVCCSCTNMGIMMAWPSSTIILFKSENTTLHRPMGAAEVSLFGSLPAIGSLIANPIAGMVLDRLGRKKCVILTSLIFVIAWSIIAFTSQVEVILMAMLVGGLGFAIFLETTIYISEICQDSIRGTMTSGPMQFYGFGILVSYFLGGYLSYHQMVYACLSLSVVGVLLLSVLKESPLTLMAKGREEDAAKSIAFYRSKKATSKEVVQELDKLRRIFHSHSEDVQSLTNAEEKYAPTTENKKMSCWQFYKTSPSTQREFFVIMILKVAFVFQGLPVVMVYAEPLFAEALPPDVISPNLCSILMGVVMIISGSISAYLTDVVGRRPLLIYSSIAAGFCCIVLGTQILTEWGPKWTIPMFIYVFTTFYTFGAGTVPVVVLAEVFLPEVKSIMSMLAVEWAWILNFLILFVFNLLVTSVGLAPVFYFFSFSCFSTAVFFFYFLPETKGLPVYAIQELFMKKK